MENTATRVTTAVKQEAPEKGASNAAPLVSAVEYLGEQAVREKSYVLKYPFRLGGVEYRTLTLKKLTGKQIFAVNAAAKQGITAEAALYSAMCGIPIAAAEALDSEDIKAISEAVQDFSPQLFEAGEQTGENGENM